MRRTSPPAPKDGTETRHRSSVTRGTPVRVRDIHHAPVDPVGAGEPRGQTGATGTGTGTRRAVGRGCRSGVSRFETLTILGVSLLAI